jgi:hypothetical protein
MAAVSAPGYPYVAPPPAPPVGPRRRRGLVAVVVAWALALTGLAVWSVRHDPPTVPEQRSIAQALPVLQGATGAMAAAAQGPDRAVLVGALHVVRGCRITPIRKGVEATRGVTVYVQADRARAALEAIAAALPDGYRARVAQSNGGKRLGLEADAGGYVAVDADTPPDAQVFTLQASTGCRPAADTSAGSADPGPAAEPAAFAGALTVLRVTAAPKPAIHSVHCPGDGVASTYTVDNLAAPGDLGTALQPALNGATVVRSDPDAWAYRLGGDSVVVTEDGGRLQVSAATPCR